MKEKEMKTIAAWIGRAVENRADKKILKQIRKETIALCKKFPIYKNLKLK